MVYIADVSSFAIYVYDLRQNRSWRTQNKLVFPHPHYGTFTIADETFDLMDGIFGLALSPKLAHSHRAYGGGRSNILPKQMYSNSYFNLISFLL